MKDLLAASETIDRIELAREAAAWVGRPLAELLAAAGRERQRFSGDRVQFCVIVNARSGACSEDCRFCAQSARHRTGAAIYPLLDAEKLLAAARAQADSGARHFGLVTSGPTVTAQELEALEKAIRLIRAETPLKPCASLGRLSEAELARLQAAGLERYHHNLETSKRFFPQICSTHSWRERVETVRAAQRVGLEVCSGGLFGLGEKWADRIDLALALRELDVRSVPLNFLTPVPGTPLADRRPLEADEGLRIIALFRLLLPRASLRICGGRPTTLGARQAELFAAGADALMTGDYLTTAGISPATDRAMVEGLGLRLE